VSGGQKMADVKKSEEKVKEPAFTGEDLTKGKVEPNTSKEAKPQEESVVTATESDAKKQSREDNAKFAEQRRQKEAKQKETELRQSFNKGVIEGIGGKNPYTKEPISDDVDLQEYLDMKNLETQGKDPVTDYPAFLKEKTRQQHKLTQEKELSDKKAQEFIEEFNTKYPGQFKQVWEDQAFQEFAEGKLNGQRSLVSVYESYQKLIGGKVEEVAGRKVVKAQSSPGSLADAGAVVPTKDWRTMSKDEFKAYVSKAKRGEFRN
jgi:hypothetical protein